MGSAQCASAEYLGRLLDLLETHETCCTRDRVEDVVYCALYLRRLV